MGGKSNRLSVIHLNIEFKLKLLFKSIMDSESDASLNGVLAKKVIPDNTNCANN